MKRCCSCGETKLIEEFNNWKKSKDGKQPRCKMCQRQYGRDNYKNNPKRKSQIRKTDKKIHVRNNEYILSILKLSQCVDCGEGDFVVLEFDHLRDKINNISYLTRQSFSLEKIQQEIDKCEIVCANCHRRRTYSRMKNCYRIQ